MTASSAASPSAPPPASSVRPSRRAGAGKRPRGHIVAAAAVAVALLPAGVAVGAVWAALVSPIRGAVVLTPSGERVVAYLGDEAEHFFIAPFLAAGLLGILAVLVSVLAWQWRAHRGPVMIAGLCLGLLGGAATALTAGALLVAGRYGAVDAGAAPITPEHRVHYFVQAPPVVFGHSPMQIGAALLLPAAVAGMIYGLCATWTPRDDLGGYPPLDGGSPTPIHVAAPQGLLRLPGTHPGVTTDGGAPPAR